MAGPFSTPVPRLRRLVLALALLPLAQCQRAPARDSVALVLPGEMRSLDPNQQTEAVTDSVLFNVYEPLVGFDENLRVQTLLAQSWEHPSPERWHFTLRPGVRFHDGSPLDAAAVRDALLALRGSPREAADALSHVTDVVATSDHEVEIVTREPRALLGSLASLYITRPSPGAPGGFVGTGPYRLVAGRGHDDVVLGRWSGYWGGPPAVREARYRAHTDPRRRLEAVASGEADIAYAIPADLARAARPGMRIVHHPGLAVYYVGVDVRPLPGNPLRDVRVRRALNLAIDRPPIIRELLLGAGDVATQPVAPAIFGYDPGLPPPAHDVEKARALLAEAGHPHGLRTALVFATARRAFAERLRTDLARIGVDLLLEEVASGGEVYAMADSGAAPLFLVGWNCTTGEASEFFEYCLHTAAPGYGRGNYGHYSNPEIDRIAESNSAILDQRERQVVLQRAAQIAMTDLPILPLWVQDDLYAVRDGVTFTPRADGEVRLLDVRVAQ